MKKRTNQSVPERSSRILNRNFRLLSLATIIGAAGGIAAEFGLSFLVFEETESTLAAAFSLFIRIIPMLLVPLAAGPVLDRFSRKKVLVLSDTGNGLVYLGMGICLYQSGFSYPVYLLFSLILSVCSSLDELAFDSILPLCITPGKEQKSYALTSMIYPTLQVIMMPAAVLLIAWAGLPGILIGQSFLSFAAAFTESRIRIEKDAGIHLDSRKKKPSFSFSDWLEDQKEALRYLKHEPGILAMQIYSAVTNAAASACYPILVAFFSVTPRFSPFMYSWFTTFECLGRVAGSIGLLRKDIDERFKYRFSMFVFTIYDLLDGILLFSPYRLMLANRSVCGFLGNISYTIRTSALQSYIPDGIRGRVNSFQSILLFFIQGAMVLAFGVLGDLFKPRTVMAIGALICLIALGLTWGRQKQACEKIFHS